MAQRKRDLHRLAGNCGTLGVASLVLLAVAGGGHIAWLMFAPFLIAMFLAIAGLVFTFGWVAAVLTAELDSVTQARGGADHLSWPRDFPLAKWLVGRCFIIAAAAIAVSLLSAWSGAAIWKGWTALGIAFLAASLTAAAIACALWSEAVYWLALSWCKSRVTDSGARSHAANRSRGHRMEKP